MDISAEKTKLMRNSANDIQREIKVKAQKLGTVTSFKYLGAVVEMMAANQRFSQGFTSHCSSYKVEADLERQQSISWIKGKVDELPCHFRISVCL